MIYFKFPWDRIGITQYYSSKHQAIDNAGTVSGKTNKYAYLPCEAKILKNTYYSDYGYAVEYEAKDERGTFVMADGHLKKKSSLVVGKTYPMSTIIGEIGTSGTSTGNHDHFRMALNGKRVNPLDYLYVYEGQFVHSDDVKKVKYLKDVAKTYEVIVDEIPYFTNSTKAKNGTPIAGNYEKGTYYIYKEANDMINITTKIGVAGGWINPKDNVIKEEIEETPVEEEKPVETIPTENTEKEPDISEEEQPSDNNTTEEEKPQETPSNEEIEDNIPIEEPKVNIFAQIIKIVIDFIIKLFRK